MSLASAVFLIISQAGMGIKRALACGRNVKAKLLINIVRDVGVIYGGSH